MTATSRRVEAIERLCAIAGGAWSPTLCAARPEAVEVLYRKALRAAQRADDPDAAIAEVRDLGPVARGRTEPLIDAALTGLPDRDLYRPTRPSWELADLEEALR